MLFGSSIDFNNALVELIFKNSASSIKTNLSLLLIDYNDAINYPNIKSTYYEILGRETNIFVITNSQNVIDELKIPDNKYLLLYKFSPNICSILIPEISSLLKT